MLAVLILTQLSVMQDLSLVSDSHQNGPLIQNNYQIGYGSAEAQVSGDINSNVDNREVSIVSISSRYDLELGAFHIFGELVNGLDTTVRNVGLNATIYDVEGNILGNASARPYIDYLRPQEKSAFDIALYGSAASAVREYSFYKILRSWDAIQQPKLNVLDFDLRNIVLDTCGYYQFTGTVGNFGNEPATNIVLSAAFYNDRNQIIKSALASIITDDESLPSIKYKPFTLLIDGQELTRFAYYSFNIQSDKYASRIFDKNEDDSFNYQNGSPILPPSSTSSGMTAMTVSTEADMYSIGPNEVKVFGNIPVLDEEDWYNNHRNSLVLIKLLSPSGEIHERVTAPILTNGSFSAGIDFRIDEKFEGQVYRVRAEYKGNAAETNFVAGYGNAGESDGGDVPIVKMTRVCKPADLSIDRMSWIPRDGYNDTDDTGDTGDNSIQGEIKAGSALILSVVAENRRTDVQPSITIIQAFDGDGKTVFLNLDNHSLDPNTEHRSNATWTPQTPGEYRIESFVITGFDEPRVLSRSINMNVKVV